MFSDGRWKAPNALELNGVADSQTFGGGVKS